MGRTRFLGFVFAVLLAAALGVAAGCGGDDDSAGVEALPASACSPLYYEGEGEPDALIASDLPLQGASRRQNVEMAEGIKYLLKERKFMAGDLHVAFQSCDDSTAQAGKWDAAKCSSNAQAYAENKKLLGVVGTFNSNCVALIIPVANRAPGGPLAIVSPANTYLGLTKSGPGTKPGEPDSYYPGGGRNFARVVAADDYQGAADALLAQQLGLKNVFILTDKELYGQGIADLTEAALQKLGIGVAGVQAWDGRQTSYEALANRVAQTGADGVFLAGIIDNNGGKLIKDMRAVLGADFPIIVPDGFTPIPAVVDEAGAASEGVYVTVAGVPTEELKGRGKEFIDGFGAATGNRPGPYAAYAAQAADLLLDAIGASDGSRQSVVDNVFSLDVKDGILGDFSISDSGDTDQNPVTAYRIVNGEQTTFTVITPPAEMVSG
ncbi:MAG: branched-chain amino acid transport system substrate-binding protein [Miltoncostaeaceae bacterium]|nr:branched-chain amino acid transport system substrate-binding protein [Miltoncostaeaceae bacterium]